MEIMLARWGLPDFASAATFAPKDWAVVTATWTKLCDAESAQGAAQASLEACKAWYDAEGQPDLHDMPGLGQDTKQQRSIGSDQPLSLPCGALLAKLAWPALTRHIAYAAHRSAFCLTKLRRNCTEDFVELTGQLATRARNIHLSLAAKLTSYKSHLEQLLEKLAKDSPCASNA